MKELWQVRQLQALPLEQKIVLTNNRIREFYSFMDGDVYVAFSGGKDSTVLLDLVRKIYPDTPAVFVDTGLEYPEVREFVKTIDNVVSIKPKIPFTKVIEKYGYPVVSKRVARMIFDLQNPTERNEKSRKGYLSGEYSHSMVLSKKWYKLIDAPFKVSHRCCDIMKKQPFERYEKEFGGKPFIGQMASDSEGRLQNYQEFGCNILEKHPKSRPLSFWMEEEIWDYIRSNNLPYSKIYDMGEERTGCVFCMFGVQMDGTPNRFQRMAKTHPKLYSYCMNKLGMKEVLEYIEMDTRMIMTLDEYE